MALDPNTEVGKLRLLIGDPNYAIWADDAPLEAALVATSGNLLRAAGVLYLQLAAQYAQQGKSIKTDDLAIDTRTRGGDFLKIAQSFFDEADGGESASANDFFQIVPFAGRPKPRRHAEGELWVC